ncbi:hypothetical protein UB31_35350 [Bradyrhizobium sp. LTSP849]|uniref:hypothetical protein n=1 Tax=unclassified Bradyrhizobium TaxID=2631580 RepID=UPI0005D1420A|nr:MULTISPECIES: hypothetical protein [unclassified Bradyrhizobium]KJC37497.1 hypothetical protein UB31_35350 [Bradyrhizobium sp. LTSP849]KJC46252.1 hypothetical protein UP06_14090 [Bradyrhizobium sp. LTSP857]
MFDEQKIKYLLNHRMQSVAMLRWAFDLRSSWREAPSIAVYVDSKLTVEGSLDAITNPMIEVGLVHCRALLEFLGLCDSKGSLGQIKDRRKTDVGVEHFQNAAGPLKKVEPEVALSRYDGDRAEAEKALVAVLHVTNKGLAHNTMDLIESPEGAKLIEIASRGVPALMVSYFYTPLGLQKPDSWITTRPREP